MREQVKKPKESKAQSLKNIVSLRQNSNALTYSFEGNRPEAIQMQRLQELANNSPQIKRLTQLQAMADQHSDQQQQPIQKKESNTGLPDDLKSGIENLSGYSMDDVKVHYNSDKPAQLNAHAYAQGTDIHLASGQEKHLPHEAWHVVQQKQGRVQPTMQMQDKVTINDDTGLEKEADVMGAKSSDFKDKVDTTLQTKCDKCTDSEKKENKSIQLKPVVQLYTQCAESAHSTDSYHRWIQSQYKTRISSGGKAEYYVNDGAHDHFVDIADTDAKEVYEIKTEAKADEARQEARDYKSLLNTHCGGGWTLGSQEEGFQSTPARGEYIKVRFPHKGVISYERVEADLSDAESLSDSD